jgi:predicted glycogen debranching enzyme
MEKLIRKIDLRGLRGQRALNELQKQWLLTNGLGGYASGTIAGSVTWRYHGLLIAALPAPLGRMLMFNHLAESIQSDDNVVEIGGAEPQGPDEKLTSEYLTEFRLENGLPFWRFEFNGIIVEKRVLLPYGQNTVHIHYKLLSDQEEVRLELRPSLHFRPHEGVVDEPLEKDYLFSIVGERFEITASEKLPPLRMYLYGRNGTFTHDRGSKREIFYQRDAERGYESRGVLWTPGFFGVTLSPGKDATLVASTEPWSTILALSPEEAVASENERRVRLVQMAPQKAQTGTAAELVLAADQFIMTPVGRAEDAARARASGDEVRSVIAGYHWFTDWGRDTMISLEGLTLTTGRKNEAGWILRTFAHYVRYGLIPNMFPEGHNEGLYHTADATLWFFHALHRYLEETNDRITLRLITPNLLDIVEHHISGTRFGIGVDPQDGLLRQGAEGYQLTWMDAKVDGWVVTPRRGKAVEINALWYNALKLLEGWLGEEGDKRAERMREYAERARESFNARFWFEQGGYLYDVIDGENENKMDSACRPNQVLAISLPYPVLDEKYWEPVMNVVHEKLLTPVGLRSLSPGHADYKAKYFGDLRARDAAYHQGTVWAWLIGPFIDAWMKLHPKDKATPRKFLEGFIPHLNDACVGSISEVFDAEAPFTPRGCIAQAWSVAEVLRCWLKTEP